MRFGSSARYLFLSALLVAALSVLLAFLLSRQDFQIAELPFQLKNKDFANYWMAGKLLAEGHAAQLFGQPRSYFEEMKAIFGADYPWHNWSYPPHAALPLLPLGLMGYLPAMALFLGLTLAFYLLALTTLEMMSQDVV